LDHFGTNSLEMLEKMEGIDTGREMLIVINHYATSTLGDSSVR
jgi:hypothetical protein